MDISSISTSLNTQGLRPEFTQKQSPDKTAESCKQFEATLWRQVIEKAMKPLLASPQGTDKSSAGIYQYFMADTLANSMSGSANGFSSMLQAQMAHQAQTSSPKD